MKSISPEEFGKIIRKMCKETGFKKEQSHSNRIAGWGNINAGVSYTYPRFDWSYYRKYQKVTDYSKQPFEEMEVSYSLGTYRYEQAQAQVQATRFNTEFRKHVPSDVYEERNGKFYVRVTNKFF